MDRNDAKRHKVVPWGCSYSEYVHMFDLSQADLGLRILGCADGPASFNGEMHKRERRVISVDPLYAIPGPEIRSRIDEARDLIVENSKAHRDAYVWTDIRSISALVKRRLSTMALFLKDYDEGLEEGRYLARSLPQLAFENRTFDLVLCSHFLFTYSTQLTCSFHAECILEMCRVGREVRIFPLLDMNGPPSPHVEPVVSRLRAAGCDVDIVAVPYEFQKGGNRMMRVRGRRPG